MCHDKTQRYFYEILHPYHGIVIPGAKPFISNDRSCFKWPPVESKLVRNAHTWAKSASCNCGHWIYRSFNCTIGSSAVGSLKSAALPERWNFNQAPPDFNTVPSVLGLDTQASLKGTLSPCLAWFWKSQKHISILKLNNNLFCRAVLDKWLKPIMKWGWLITARMETDCDMDFWKSIRMTIFQRLKFYSQNRWNFACSVDILQEIAFNYLVRVNLVPVTYI